MPPTTPATPPATSARQREKFSGESASRVSTRARYAPSVNPSGAPRSSSAPTSHGKRARAASMVGMWPSESGNKLANHSSSAHASPHSSPPPAVRARSGVIAANTTPASAPSTGPVTPPDSPATLNASPPVRPTSAPNQSGNRSVFIIVGQPARLLRVGVEVSKIGGTDAMDNPSAGTRQPGRLPYNLMVSCAARFIDFEGLHDVAREE